MTEVVVDASLAAMWALPEKHSAVALDRAEGWAAEGTRLTAPCLLLAEVSNAFYKRVLRRELDVPTAQAAMRIVLGFAIELVEEAGLPERAIEIARQLAQPTTYDCHYLALAEARDCELWTGDRRFFAAVHDAVPRVRWVGALAGDA